MIEHQFYVGQLCAFIHFLAAALPPAEDSAGLVTPGWYAPDKTGFFSQ
jgi:hypothetical protein